MGRHARGATASGGVLARPRSAAAPDLLGALFWAHLEIWFYKWAFEKNEPAAQAYLRDPAVVSGVQSSPRIVDRTALQGAQLQPVVSSRGCRLGTTGQGTCRASSTWSGPSSSSSFLTHGATSVMPLTVWTQVLQSAI